MLQSIVRDCLAIGNQTGIRGQDGDVIRDSLSALNTGDGILVAEDALVTGNLARANGAAGIRGTERGLKPVAGAAFR